MSKKSPKKSSSIRPTGFSHVLLFGLWLSILCIPYFRTEYTITLFERTGYDHNAIYYLFVVALIFQIAEALLVGSTVRYVLSSRLFQSMQHLTTSITLFILFFYHFLVFLGWSYQETSSYFISPSVFRSILSFVSNNGGLQTLNTILTHDDQLQFLYIILLDICTTIVAYSAMRLQKLRIGTQVFTAITLLLFAGGVLSFGPFVKEPVPSFIRLYASPISSLLWAPIFSPTQATPLPPPLEFTLHKTISSTDLETSQPDIYVFVVESLRADSVQAPLGPTVAPYLHSLLLNSSLSAPFAITQASETSESLVTIITGNYVMQVPYRDLRKKIERVSILQKASQFGYSSAFIGEVWESDKELMSRGVSMFFNPITNPSTKETLFGKKGYDMLRADYIKMHHLLGWSKQQDNPIVAITYLQGMHFPYTPGETTPNTFQPIKLGPGEHFLGYSPKWYLPMKNRYNNLTLETDQLLQQTIQELKKIHPNRETVIIITGDHGELFGEHGQTTHGGSFYPEIVTVPWLIDAPPGWYRTTNRPAHIDVAPTIARFAGIPVDDLQGVSAVSRDRAEKYAETRPIFGSSLSFRNEDHVVVGDKMLVLSYVESNLRMFNLTNNNEVPPDDEALCACILSYRSNQFAFYATPPAFRNTHNPYHWDACPVSPQTIPDICQR